MHKKNIKTKNKEKQIDGSKTNKQTNKNMLAFPLYKT